MCERKKFEIFFCEGGADRKRKKQRKKRAAGEQKKSKKQKAKRREKRKKETQDFFVNPETQILRFLHFSLRKNSSLKKKNTNAKKRREDFERESLEERCLLTRARRRIEWKRNPSMKRSHRSPCWYELNVFILRVVLLCDWEERRIRQPFFFASSSFTSLLLLRCDDDDVLCLTFGRAALCA